MKGIERFRILLINPPFYRLYKETYSYNKYPLSLGYLAATIRDNTSWSPTVYNGDFAIPTEKGNINYFKKEGFESYRKNLENPSRKIWGEVKAVIQEIKPNVVGIYCCSSNSKSASNIAQIVKAIDKNIIVVMGGPHPTLSGIAALENPNVDIIVKGEGELTIIELLQKIETKQAIDQVKGIIYRSGMDVIENPKREQIENLDTLNFPSKYAKEVLRDYNKYPISAFNTIITSRGCPGNCFFCGSHSVFKESKQRSIENIVQEIQYLQKLGLNRFEFLDDTFGQNKKFLKDLCSMIIKKCPRIKWQCETRADLIDEETARLMKKAGCYQIEMGIESGNNKLLQQMRKRVTIEQAKRAAKIINKNHIKLLANFLIGLPMETKETLNDTYKAMQQIKGRINYSIFTPYPGSEAFEYCKNANLLDNYTNPAYYNHKSPENYFCSIDKKLFDAMSREIEKYVDQRNAKEDLKQIFSKTPIERVINCGTFRDYKSFKNFSMNALIESKALFTNIIGKKSNFSQVTGKQSKDKKKSYDLK